MQNLIVYQFNTLYEILKEIDQNLNFKIIEAKNEKSLNNEINISKKYLIATIKKNHDLENQIIFEKFPIKMNELEREMDEFDGKINKFEGIIARSKIDKHLD